VNQGNATDRRHASAAVERPADLLPAVCGGEAL
jgi:hypothetical protein